MQDYKYSLAQDYYHRGQFDNSIDLLKELLSDEPNTAEFHGLLAACLLQGKRHHAAEFELKLALQLNSENAFFFVLLAQVFLLKNNTKKALSSCDDALRIAPNEIDAFFLKSDIYMMLNEYEKALKHLHDAAYIAPDSTKLKSHYGNYYLEQRDLDKAELYAREALAQEPEDEAANILIGRIKLLQGDIKEAEYHAKFVIRQNPDSEQALILFCDIKMRQNWLLGIWWRFNSSFGGMSNMKMAFVLISGFFIFNFLSQIFSDLGYEKISSLTTYTWLVMVAYSWFGIPFYYKKLEKELDKFSFRNDF